MISGLAGGQDPGDLARSFFEGWSFSVRFLIEQIEAFSRRSFTKVTLCGGGVNVPLALEIQAAVLNKPLEIADVPEAAALGACLLAGKALGMGDTAGRKAFDGPARGGRLIRPRPEWAEVYDGVYRREYVRCLRDKEVDNTGKQGADSGLGATHR
jgi:xylulokinase